MAHSFRFLYWKVCCYVCTRKPKKSSRLRRTRTARRSNSGRQSGRYPSANRTPTSLRRSQRASQRSADSAMSDSAVSQASYSASDQESRYYDETERDFEMMPGPMNGPQRGRRSQHHSRNNRPSGGGHPGVHRPTGRPGNQNETELGAGATSSSSEHPSTPTSPTGRIHDQQHALESGYYNKYADPADQHMSGKGGRGSDPEHHPPRHVRSGISKTLRGFT